MGGLSGWGAGMPRPDHAGSQRPAPPQAPPGSPPPCGRRLRRSRCGNRGVSGCPHPNRQTCRYHPAPPSGRPPFPCCQRGVGALPPVRKWPKVLLAPPRGVDFRHLGVAVSAPDGPGGGHQPPGPQRVRLLLGLVALLELGVDARRRPRPRRRGAPGCAASALSAASAASARRLARCAAVRARCGGALVLLLGALDRGLELAQRRREVRPGELASAPWPPGPCARTTASGACAGSGAPPAARRTARRRSPPARGRRARRRSWRRRCTSTATRRAPAGSRPLP